MLITLLEKANLAAIHCQRIMLMPKNIDLAIKLSDMMVNYKTTVSVSRESPEEKKKNEEMRRKELDKMTRLKQCKSGKDSNSNPPVHPRSSGVGHIIDLISPLGTDSSDEEQVQITHHPRKQKSSSLESDNSESEPTLFRRCSKKLDKSQYDYFTENGFTDEFIMIVMDLGGDRIDVENYILLYNNKNNKKVPFPEFKRKKDVYGKKKNEKKKNANKNDRCKERKDEGIESESNEDSSDGRGVKKSDKAKEQKSQKQSAKDNKEKKSEKEKKEYKGKRKRERCK